VRIDLSAAQLWDVTAVGALEDIVAKLRRNGRIVEVIGLNRPSETLVERHAPGLSTSAKD
jgi:SulP family sulfate permease